MNKKWKTTLLICTIACTVLLAALLPLEFAYAATEAVSDAAAESTDSIIQQAGSLLIFKRTQPNSNSVTIADKLVNNELYVNSIWPTYPYTEQLTWRENPYDDESWVFYLHSLDLVGFLMNAYEKNPSPVYLEKAKWFIESWMAANPSPAYQASEYAWDDHSTANRVVNMIYFWHYYKNSSLYDPVFEQSLIDLLEKHGEFLADDRHYTAHNNHGIFQDRSLIELALLFPNMEHSQDWYNKAMNRLMIHVQNDVTASGVHKEHSPDYHNITLDLFRGVNAFIAQFDKKSDELTSAITKMEDYLSYLIKPDGTLPMLGDSDPNSLYSLNVNKITSEKLKYVLSNGTQGIKPINDAIYPDAGVAIFRKVENVAIPFHFVFTAAYHSNVHKHADDLSFLLTYGKTDFFVDSGKYNYNETDPYRKYFRSTMAHNTITVDGKSYPLGNKQIKKSKIDHYRTASTYSYVTGSHELYSGVSIQRTVIYLRKTNSILIHDVMTSPEFHEYSEVFNLGKEVQVKSNDQRTFLLKSTIEDNMIEFKHLTEATSFNQYNGLEDPIAGWQSIKFNEKLPITQLQFTTDSTQDMEYKFVINTDLKVGVERYNVNSEETYTLYTIQYKNGKREHIRIYK